MHIQALIRGLTTSPNICSKHLFLSKAKQRLRADGSLMPHLHKALTLNAMLLRHFKKS